MHHGLVQEQLALSQIQYLLGFLPVLLVFYLVNNMLLEHYLYVLKAFQPFSVTQRSTLVSEYETAYAKKTKSILSPEMIMPLATVGLLGIVIMLVVIYWGELAKPITDMASMNLQMQQENTKMADLNAKTMAMMQGGTVVFTQEVHGSNSSALISGGSTEKPPT